MSMAEYIKSAEAEASLKAAAAAAAKSPAIAPLAGSMAPSA